MGEHNSKTTEDGHKKCEYKMSLLEEAILGFLKERMVDRQRSDLTKRAFHYTKYPFADRFAACIKHEWTSKKSEEDTGVRTEMEGDLIQRHMMRSAYWPSQWYNDAKNRRRGEDIRKSRLDGDNDPLASIELSEFEVTVKLPAGQQQQGCVQQ